MRVDESVGCAGHREETLMRRASARVSESA
jgi:hypothetical protein